MRYHIYSEADMIEKSRDLIHAFMGRQMLHFAGLLDEHFVWIGDYSSQYIQGKNAFLKTITDEIKLPPLELSAEEYRVLTHERHTWITYGRCTVTTNLEADQPLSNGIHFTFVWKQLKNDIYLLLAAANHVQDEQDAACKQFSNAAVLQARVFDHVKTDTIIHKGTPKIQIRSLSGNLYFLFPDEIVYAASKDKHCTIYTVSEMKIVSYMSLNTLEQTGFLRIHSRYLVNRSFITCIRRHEVTLVDKTVLPVGKQRYNEVVEMLKMG